MSFETEPVSPVNSKVWPHDVRLVNYHITDVCITMIKKFEGERG